MRKLIFSTTAICTVFLFSCKNPDKQHADHEVQIMPPAQNAASLQWLQYTDDNLGIAFQVPRSQAEGDSAEYASGIIRSLGWMKPSDAAIDNGLNTFLCYEDGFMLHIWDSTYTIMKAKDFAAYAEILYQSNQRTKDAFVKYKDGKKMMMGTENAYTFSIPLLLKSKECRNEFENAAVQVEKTIQEPAENTVYTTAVYFTHDNHHFRILYDENNPDAQKIFESFTLQ